MSVNVNSKMDDNKVKIEEAVERVGGGATKGVKNVPLEGGKNDIEKPAVEPQNEPQNEGRNADEKWYEKLSEKGARKFPSWIDLFAAMGVFVLSSLVGSLVAVLIVKLRGAEGFTPDVTLIYYLIQMLPPIAFVARLRRKAGRPNVLHFGVRKVNLPTLLWGVVVLMASSVVLEPLLLLFPKEEYQNVTDMVGLGGWAILSVVVCAPILEEILFRGLIFESCRERFGGGVAVLISALLFGLVHGVPVQIINAFVVGLIFGYVYLRTGSLLSVILLHVLNNGIAYISLAFFGDAAETTLRDLVGPNWLYWLIYALAAVVFAYAMVRLVQTIRDENEVE